MVTASLERPTRTFRQATLKDLPELRAMFQAFQQSTQYARYVGETTAVAAGLIERLINGHDGAIFVVQTGDVLTGMLGVLAYAHPMSGERCATELFWWLDPAHRGAGGWLLRRAEAWAKAQGARRMVMVAPADNLKVGDMYQALGYDSVEVMYQKDLT